MKHIDTFKLVVIIFAITVAVVIIMAVAGITFNSHAVPTPEQVKVREKLLELVSVIATGVLLAITTKKFNDKNDNT